MIIRTSKDLGAAIRDQRRRNGLDQQALAEKIGVSRQWIVEVEKGKARAEVGLILRALEALGFSLSLSSSTGTPATSDEGANDIDQLDIDQVVSRARGKPNDK